MKRLFLMTVLLCVCAIGAQAQAPTPSPTSNGPVSRITYYRIKPGKTADFTKDLQQNAKPVLDELKKQGLILDYKFYTQPTSSGPTDWDRVQVLVFRNYAEALDFDADRAKKLDAIFLKHYGTAEARSKRDDGLRDVRDVLSSHLVRELIVNPIQ
jgi:hypothetical protein